MPVTLLTANQYPHRKNYLSRFFRKLASNSTLLGMVSRPMHPLGISVIMRVKDEVDWIRTSIRSIKSIADEIVIVDNGSTDGTYEILREIAGLEKGLIKLWRQPDLDHCSLSNFALDQTTFRCIFRWDGDMVAHTNGAHPISHLRDRLLSLDGRRYYIVYLRHINLAGDLFHQDPKEMVHIEEYIHTFSEEARYVHPGRFEAVKFPKYYRPLFWYEPYSFHVNVKPARRMLIRHFWEDWMELKDYRTYPRLEDYVEEKVEKEFETKSWEQAQETYVRKVCQDYIPYNPDVFGPYPDLLKPHLESPKYSLKYKDGKIVGRDEF
jgi:glycosyltransferase involved in cell wall biosynthesis